MDDLYETTWETPITPDDEDTCPECGGNANEDGCRSDCPYFNEY